MLKNIGAMETHVDSTLFKNALVILGAAAIVVPVFHSLKLSPVLGYIIIGMIVGPFGLGALARDTPWLGLFTITGTEGIGQVAEFGVVLLLFTIGLELTLERLNALRRLVFGLGALQVILSTAVIAAIAYLMLGTWPAAIVLGLALAMSSSAVVLQVLAAQKETRTPVGRMSFSVLLFQDLAVVPILFAVTLAGRPSEGSMVVEFALAVGQAALAIIFIFALARLVIRPLFRSVAATKSPELFMAACLLVILATGLATAVAGLSMTMGALIAGVVLAETEFHREIEVMIEPFKGLLVGVFLISIGMSVDLQRIANDPAGVAIAASGLVALKAGIVALLARPFGFHWGAGAQAGLLLGAGSEFSFVIVALAASLNLIDAGTSGFALIIIALTMAAIPLLHALGKVLERRWEKHAPHPVTLVDLPEDETPRIIIAGYGRVGQVVASLLEKHNLPYIAVDYGAETVARARDNGKPVYYGNIRNPEFLRRSGIASARALVVTMDAPRSASDTVRIARAEREDLQIIVRARDAAHASELYRLGATDAVPETVEASLQLGEAVLVDVGVPMGLAIASIHEARSEIRSYIQETSPQFRLPVRKRLRDSKPAGANPAAADPAED